MIGLIADTHIRGKDWDDKKIVLNQIKEQFSQQGVKYILNLGDLFNQGRIGDKYVSAGVITSWLGDWLSSQDIALISIEGNHDQTTQESAFDVFRHPLQVVVKNDVSWLNIEGHCFICVPWLTNNRVGCDARLFAKQMIGECVQDIEKRRAEGSPTLSVNLIGHMDAIGASIRNNIAISSEEYSKYAFDLSALEKDLNFQFDNVFLGHLHSRQPVRVSQRKSGHKGYYGYLGYTSPLGFGESVNPFGWALFGKEDTKFFQIDAPRFYSLDASVVPEQTILQQLRPWDHLRVSGEGAEGFAALATCKHKEVIGDSLHIQSVNAYLEKKDSTFKEIFNEWLKLANLEINDRSIIDEYIEKLNVKWDSLTGRMGMIKKIELTNIGPHLSFSQEFGLGISAILGENGSGKSTIAESFTFAAFGHWITDRGTLSSFMDKDSKVAITFEIDHVEYKVVRTSKEMTVFNSSGVEVTKGLKKTSRQFLESIIGDMENFLQCSFVSQTGKYDIIETPPSARMQMLRYFLKLDVFDDYLEEVRDELKSNKELLRIAKNHIADESSLISSRVEVIQNIATNKDCLASALARAGQAQETINLYAQEHININEYKVKERHLEESLIKIKYLEREKDSLEKDYYISEEPLSEKDVAKKVEERSKVSNLLYQADRDKSKYKQLKSLSEGIKLDTVGCAPNYLPCRLIDKFLEAKRELDLLDTGNFSLQLEETISELQVKVYRLDKELQKNTNLIQSVNSIQANLSKTKFSIKSQETRADKLVEELKSIVISDHLFDIPLTMQLLEKANKEIGNLKFSAGKMEQLLESFDNDLLSIEKYKSEIAQLEHTFSSYEVLEKAFSKNGISHYLASSALPELQEIFNSLLQVSFDDRLKIVFENIESKAKTIKESFSIIKTNSRRPHDVRHCSGGEKAVLKLLWKLTLLVYQNRRNEGYRCLILDEPTAWMDDENVEATINLLQHVSNKFDQILLVTHSEELSLMASNTIRLY